MGGKVADSAHGWRRTHGVAEQLVRSRVPWDAQSNKKFAHPTLCGEFGWEERLCSLHRRMSHSCG